jgi:hypothetical protein
VCSCRVPEPGVLVVGVTSWSEREFVPRSRVEMFGLMKV